jgi:hypothetical protein
MWRLFIETQDHSTNDTGLIFGTPETAYAAVEAWCERAMEYEEETNGTDPDGPGGYPTETHRWKEWLKAFGWPEGGIPIIRYDDGREMMDDGGGCFEDWQR